MVEGEKAAPVNYNVVPACTYTTPEIASVGLRERQAKEQEIDYIVGNFPFTASGKATAMGARDGFVKLLFEAHTHQLIGAHIDCGVSARYTDWCNCGNAPSYHSPAPHAL